MFRSREIATTFGLPSPPAPRVVIRYMLGKPLDFDPGTRYAYSNFGYCVLGRVIETIAGTSYEKFVLEKVLAPIGIRQMRIGASLADRRVEGEVQYYTRHDEIVSPKLRSLRTAFKRREIIQDDWLEEKLRELLAAMLQTQETVKHETDALPALRASTREELGRRVNRARDFLHAHLSSAIKLSDVATAACLSPFHLLRTFQAVFRQTPHQYLSQCRLERAKFLLEKTRVPVTAICLDCGFTSLGSFSTFFQKSCGMSPREWRVSRGVVVEENSKIEEVFLTGPE